MNNGKEEAVARSMADADRRTELSSLRKSMLSLLCSVLEAPPVVVTKAAPGLAEIAELSCILWYISLLSQAGHSPGS